MKVEISSDVQGVVRDWDALAERVGATPWLRSGWILPWHQAFGSGPLLAAVGRVGGQVRAVMPLMRRWGMLRSPSNWHTPAFGVVAEEADVGAFFDGLLGLRPRALSLYFLEDAGPDQMALEFHGRARGFRLLTRELEHSPYVSLTGEWEQYEESLPTKLKSEIRRRTRKLESTGSVRVELPDTSSSLGSLLEEGFAIESAGWKGARGTAISSNRQTREFYSRVAVWAAEEGWLRLAFLRHDDASLAFDLAFEFDGVHYLLKTGFDPGWQKFGPGMILRRHMLKGAFQSHLTLYDFLGRDESWKMQWTDTVRARLVYQAFAPVKGALDWGAWRYGRPATKRAFKLVKK
ncbi:MAG: GNAT family N-acetyltransferase [Actinomycetota bacterium]|nr:GNAT family N-acetyltransferase [Actinomycetota bacterium]